jgi:hypothetical protein
MGEGTAVDLTRVGYVQHEYAAAGTATSYKAAGTPTPEGRFQYVSDASASYRTRVLVRAPAKAAAFSGTVVVEWLNVSGGAGGRRRRRPGEGAQGDRPRALRHTRAAG